MKILSDIWLGCFPGVDIFKESQGNVKLYSLGNDNYSTLFLIFVMHLSNFEDYPSIVRL